MGERLGHRGLHGPPGGVTEPATLTLRYTPLITTTCIIYRGTDPKPYEVISVNDVENRHAWLEVKVQRKGAVR